ncbi:hypothetical protein M071_1868 [Bacteroides fragilis str. Ds-233]|nr:hypothetical protein M071_1868 [Bacteroides fragilis str. Ds-233]
MIGGDHSSFKTFHRLFSVRIQPSIIRTIRPASWAFSSE